MTNQEAIARIREHKIIHKMNEPRAIYISEALDMAIEALENQKSVIEELEMMWEKIRALPDINPDYPMDKTIHISRYEVQKIVYECISELKGENNEQSQTNN